MTKRQFRKYVNTFADLFRRLAPRDTGNLAFNSIKVIFTSDSRAVVYVDEKIAPYMPFTDRPWLSPKWKGKKNPNEGWFERAVEEALRGTNSQMKGKVIKK